MDFTDFIKGELVLPDDDVGQTSSLRATPQGPRVTLTAGGLEQPVFAWKGREWAPSRIRFDFTNVSTVGASQVVFRVLSCSGCKTERGLVVSSRKLTIAVPTKGRDFAGITRGGFPGPYWVLLARAVNANVKFGVDAWFDRFGDSTEHIGPEIA